LACSSKVRNMHRKAACTPAAIGFLPIPDPRTWPVEARDAFRELRGDCSPLDVFIFVFASRAAMYLQDAVTAIGILEVDPSGWHTEGGYPFLEFESSRVTEYGQRLTASGYSVRIVKRDGQGSAGSGPPRAQVVDIASARPKRKIL
jgi:hypothetical protein